MIWSGLAEPLTMQPSYVKRGGLIVSMLVGLPKKFLTNCPTHIRSTRAEQLFGRHTFGRRTTKPYIALQDTLRLLNRQRVVNDPRAFYSFNSARLPITL